MRGRGELGKGEGERERKRGGEGERWREVEVGRETGKEREREREIGREDEGARIKVSFSREVTVSGGRPLDLTCVDLIWLWSTHVLAL